MCAVNLIPSLCQDKLLSEAERPSPPAGATVTRIFAGGTYWTIRNAQVHTCHIFDDITQGPDFQKILEKT